MEYANWKWIIPAPGAFDTEESKALGIAADLADQRHENQNGAPMALPVGKLLIRDQNQIVCVKVAV